MKTPPSPSKAEHIRLTVSVSPEVHAAYSRLAKASGMSLGRTMGEWLGDTVDAATFTADKVEQARAAPKVVMREMHAYAMGLADETGALLRSIGSKGAAGRLAQSGAAPDATQSQPPPRLVIRGGKYPKTGKGKGS